MASKRPKVSLHQTRIRQCLDVGETNVDNERAKALIKARHRQMVVEGEVWFGHQRDWEAIYAEHKLPCYQLPAMVTLWEFVDCRRYHLVSVWQRYLTQINRYSYHLKCTKFTLIEYKYTNQVLSLKGRNSIQQSSDANDLRLRVLRQGGDIVDKCRNVVCNLCCVLPVDVNNSETELI